MQLRRFTKICSLFWGIHRLFLNLFKNHLSSCFFGTNLVIMVLFQIVTRWKWRSNNYVVNQTVILLFKWYWFAFGSLHCFLWTPTASYSTWTPKALIAQAWELWAYLFCSHYVSPVVRQWYFLNSPGTLFRLHGLITNIMMQSLLPVWRRDSLSMGRSPPIFDTPECLENVTSSKPNFPNL